MPTDLTDHYHSTLVARLGATRGQPPHQRRGRRSSMHPRGNASGVPQPQPSPPAPQTRPAARCPVRQTWAPSRGRGCHGCAHKRQRTPARPPRLFGDASGEGGGVTPGSRWATRRPPAQPPYRLFAVLAFMRRGPPAAAELAGERHARWRGSSWPPRFMMASGGQADKRGQRGAQRSTFQMGEAAEQGARFCTWRPTQCPPCRHTADSLLHTAPAVRQQKVKV